MALSKGHRRSTNTFKTAASIYKIETRRDVTDHIQKVKYP